jgi:hypothetical protein
LEPAPRNGPEETTPVPFAVSQVTLIVEIKRFSSSSWIAPSS